MNENKLTTGFCLDDYIEHERQYIDACYDKQLEYMPKLTKTMFILQYYVPLGYAQQYHEYYMGNRHKKTYEPIKQEGKK